MNKQFDHSLATIETTIGELIEAVTQVALEAGKSEEESYELASRTLESILTRSDTLVEIEYLVH